eukprot:CAMPEP_0203940506 /NCGR_PEP_ID=MMETSP0359-20131031/77076_1 /ASSEMBLY_ACC=CAM_ASM_000338 /TAXON_ID=268821 /ORGANISM="Scrippsiella Hangoei, Strain SHTV-5" /LENGTH=209 /DNA_ID=CAMNT_0050870951 /DNA_START=146 /DNA_END=777 /DNA_ORIENTATION=+
MPAAGAAAAAAGGAAAAAAAAAAVAAAVAVAAAAAPGQVPARPAAEASHHGGVVREEGGIIEGPAASVGKAKVHTTVCTEELLRRREGRVLAQHLARAWGLDAGAMAEVDPAHEGDTVPRVASRLAGERRGRRDHRERLHRAAAGGRRAAEGGRHRVVAQTGHAVHAVHAVHASKGPEGGMKGPPMGYGFPSGGIMAAASWEGAHAPPI